MVVMFSFKHRRYFIVVVIRFSFISFSCHLNPLLCVRYPTDRHRMKTNVPKILIVPFYWTCLLLYFKKKCSSSVSCIVKFLNLKGKQCSHSARRKEVRSSHYFCVFSVVSCCLTIKIINKNKLIVAWMLSFK